MEQTATNKWKIIRLVYLYLVSLIGLVVFLFGGVGMVNTGLQTLLNVDDSYYGNVKQMCRDPYQVGMYSGKVPVAPTAVSGAKPESVTPVDTSSQEYKDCVKDQEDEQKKQSQNNRRRDIALGLAQMLLGTPVWLYHWRVIQRDHKQSV